MTKARQGDIGKLVRQINELAVIFKELSKVEPKLSVFRLGPVLPYNCSFLTPD